jgi:hypothetical protein
VSVEALLPGSSSVGRGTAARAVWDTAGRVGAWRSLVARTVRVGEVPSSNLGAPINSFRLQVFLVKVAHRSYILSGSIALTVPSVRFSLRGFARAVQAVIPRMSSLATSSGSLNMSIVTARSSITVNASTANGCSPSNATAPAAPLMSAG